MPTAPTFSPQDAQNLINIAARAPLQNLSEAKVVDQLIAQFHAWYEHVTKPKAPDKTKPVKDRQASTAGQSADPAS